MLTPAESNVAMSLRMAAAISSRRPSERIGLVFESMVRWRSSAKVGDGTGT